MSRPKGSKNKPKDLLASIQKQAGLYDYELTRQSNIRSYLFYANPDENESFDYATRMAFLNEVKYAIRNQPIFSSIITKVENHVIGDGLSVKFQTGDSNFDAIANKVLDNYWNNAFCVVNQVETGYDVQKLLANYLMKYGEFFLLLTESQTGYPQFQIIEPENVSSPDGDDIDGKLIDGCYIDSNYKILAYSVKTGKETWQKVDASNVIHCKLSRAGNSLRGISPFSSALVAARHLRDLINLEMASAKAQAAHAFIVTKHGGSANDKGVYGPTNLRSAQVTGGTGVTTVNASPATNAQGIPMVPNPPATKVFNGGSAVYLDIGESITPVTTQRLTAPFATSIEILESQICYAAGLDYYFITKANSVTTGEVRFSITDAQAWFRQFQNKLIYGAFQRLNIYIASKLIKIGMLPQTKGNIFSIDFGRPAILTIDRQRENDVALELIAAGKMTDNQFFDERGMSWEAIYDERLSEWKIKNMKRAAYGLPPVPFLETQNDLEITPTVIKN